MERSHLEAMRLGKKGRCVVETSQHGATPAYEPVGSSKKLRCSKSGERPKLAVAELLEKTKRFPQFQVVNNGAMDRSRSVSKPLLGGALVIVGLEPRK